MSKNWTVYPHLFFVANFYYIKKDFFEYSKRGKNLWEIDVKIWIATKWVNFETKKFLQFKTLFGVKLESKDFFSLKSFYLFFSNV